ncbi:CBO0543 family protein [Clostridium folliculivorans]|uniref:Uncharacterized protein n=1 Tax=Clostridium folliculivorans TaxID=2886038 RepID=A0A9W6DD57_9CLOT|nr:CBO0543 family protein [Clostridium folliculivorans]GKU27602.1 hypothetical protein CFOLD11_44290 [Clostridium folliculivorans]GKU32503.1 hypothetical protein CFB3_46110 [Clostridium folliculivorans]
MDKNYIFIIIGWVVTIGLLFKFVPRDKIREAHVAFFFKQLLTWLLGLLVVQLGLIEYPVRLFPYANKTSFSFEYFIYPSICAIFNVHYPEKESIFKQFLYYFYYCTTITVVEIYVEKFTNIIKYVHWNWYVTWITLFLTFYLTRKYYTWFFKLKHEDK